MYVVWQVMHRLVWNVNWRVCSLEYMGSLLEVLYLPYPYRDTEGMFI